MLKDFGEGAGEGARIFSPFRKQWVARTRGEFQN
jgi:hypothetical protein